MIKIYRYLLFAYSMYYPCGAMNDCVAKFNNPLDLDFDNIDLYEQFYVVYDSKTDTQHGISMEHLVEEFEEEYGELTDYQEDEIRLRSLKDLIKKSVK